MAHLSLPGESATGVSRALPFRDRRAHSPISRSTSPLAKAGDTATVVAFKNARDTYRKSLSEKDLKRIMLPSGPEDVVNDIEQWHKRHLDSKVTASIRSGLGQLQRFSASIDMLAQGAPSPGCLLWGSIKFVLTIVQDAVQAYEQLCKALVRMIDCLPRIEIYAETFFESSLVADCLNAFYVSAIKFWARACKFYSRGRLWRALRSIWNDFDTEFSSLEAEMIRNRDRVEGAALAEHIRESKATTMSQQFMNYELLEAQMSTRRKEIIAWLAPIAYDVEYFSIDLANARALRHPKTCTWVLNKAEMVELCDSRRCSEKPLLWIRANPGAGKTVLSSFLIDHFEAEESDSTRGHVFYFFCKNTDADKNTPTAVARSLLYQVYKSAKDQKLEQSLNDDFGLALDRSGQQKAVNFTVLWQLIYTHIKNVTPATVILDALDECQESTQLIQRLKELSTFESIKVILTSRKELHLHNELEKFPSIEIAPEDINADIVAFVEAKVSESSRLSHPLVRDRVITRLCNSHDGMFLWVYLMLKELKFCISMTQVQDALRNLPTGLDGIYKSIVQRLQTTLAHSSLDLCSKVLTWVVSATRPLSIEEIKQALTIHYEKDGDTLLTDDRAFPYSDKDIELICGSLVTIRKGLLQVIHLTVKEFLRLPQEIGGSSSSSLLVDPEHGSLQLTLVCLRCIANYAEPLIDLRSDIPQIDWALDSGALKRCQTQAPLLEYACFSWLAHMIDCKPDDLLKITSAFKDTFNSSATFSWVETCMAFQPDGTLRLLVGVDEVRNSISDSGQNLQPQQDVSSHFLANWCHVMSRVFEQYGAILARRPWEIYLIDLCDIFSSESSTRKLWKEYGETSLRAIDVRLNGYRPLRPPHEVSPPHLQLQKSLQSDSFSVFLVHVQRQNVYVWGETEIQGDNHRIFVQHDKTGQRLPPAEYFGGESGQHWHLDDHALSPNGRHLVMYYMGYSSGSNSWRGLTIAWRINEDIGFKGRMNRESWARVVSSHKSEKVFWVQRVRAVTFEDDNCCVTPCGRLNILTNSTEPLPARIIDSAKQSNLSFFGCGGRYLFVSGPSELSDDGPIQTQRFDLLDSNQPVACYRTEKGRHSIDVSPSGRYLVSACPPDGPTFELEEEMVYLYDTDSRATVRLPLLEPLAYRDCRTFFSHDETRFTAFIRSINDPQELNIVIWDRLPANPRLLSYLRWDVGSIPLRQLHVYEDATSAILVTRERNIQRIELSNGIEVPDVSKLTDDFPYSLSAIHRDCSHWTLVRYGSKGGKVQIINLAFPDTPARTFELEWSQKNIPDIRKQDHFLPSCISTDLRVLIINGEVFDLAITNDEWPCNMLALNSFTMEGASTLLKLYRDRNKFQRLKCRISPCNSYVTYVGEGDQWGDRSRYSPAIYIFRIDLKDRTSARLELSLPEDLISLSASFHPSLPLLAISYGFSTATKTELRQANTPPPLYLKILDLKSLTMTDLDLPNERPTEGPTKAIADQWYYFGLLPRICFSDCGTFAFLKGGVDHDPRLWFQEIYRLNVNTVPLQCIFDGTPYAPKFLSSNNSFLQFIDDDNGSLALRLMKLDETGFWTDTRPRIQLNNITSCSLNHADANHYLLLGANHDEKMRLLIVPRDDGTPVIKTMSLTFTEARSRLEREWERLQPVSQGQDFDINTETDTS